MSELKIFIKSVDWLIVAHLTTALLYIIGAIWLVLLLAATYEAHQQSWLVLFPYLAFVPVYAFLGLYGLKQISLGHQVKAWICTLANFCILAMF